MINELLIKNKRKYTGSIQKADSTIIKNHIDDLEIIKFKIKELIRCAGHPNNAHLDYDIAEWRKQDTSGLMVITVDELKELLGDEK